MGTDPHRLWDLRQRDRNLEQDRPSSELLTGAPKHPYGNFTRGDPAEINIGNNDVEDLRKTLCHEVGHSVGLLHGALDDCMRNGEIPNTNVQYRRYNFHHRAEHINLEY
jgi:hypothetical protein